MARLTRSVTITYDTHDPALADSLEAGLEEYVTHPRFREAGVANVAFSAGPLPEPSEPLVGPE